MKIRDLYFGIVLFDFNSKELKQYNLFNSLRVQRSIAIWVTMDEDEKRNHDALHFCFGDTQGRCEYEMLVQDWPATKMDKVLKVDTYQMYVEPNRDYLLSLVDKVTKTDAKKWLKENK